MIKAIAAMAQSVEHVLGKDEVTSSSLVSSSNKSKHDKLCKNLPNGRFFAIKSVSTFHTQNKILRVGQGGKKKDLIIYEF